MIQNSQKMLLHHYARKAGLPDLEYRGILSSNSGCSSAADPRMNQSGFEHAMAALETVLFERVHAGRVPNPIGHDYYIRSEFYWRNRLPSDGKINSRQFHIINDLWAKLCPHLSADQRNPVYFAGIVHHATGRPDIGASALTHAQAGAVIDALTDRLKHAIKSLSDVPF